MYRDIEGRGSSVRVGNRDRGERSGKVHVGSLVSHGDDLMASEMKGICRAEGRDEELIRGTASAGSNRRVVRMARVCGRARLLLGSNPCMSSFVVAAASHPPTSKFTEFFLSFSVKSWHPAGQNPFTPPPTEPHLSLPILRKVSAEPQAARRSRQKPNSIAYHVRTSTRPRTKHISWSRWRWRSWRWCAPWKR